MKPFNELRDDEKTRCGSCDLTFRIGRPARFSKELIRCGSPGCGRQFGHGDDAKNYTAVVWVPKEASQ